MLTAATNLLLRTTVRRWFERDDVPAMRRKLDRMQGLLDAAPAGEAVGPGLVRYGAGDGPGVLYLHGGGYIVGGPASHGAFCARLSRAVGGPVVLVEYRLAPEAPYPAALEDAAAAWDAVAADGRRLWLAGDSAGGGLALALAQRLATAERRPERVLLISPWLDFTLSGDSMSDCAARDAVLSAAILGRMRDCYAGGQVLLSPLDGRVAGLPPVRIVCSSDEVLRDDSRRLAARVREAGGDVVLREWKRQPHIFPVFKLLPAAAPALRFLVGV